MLILSLAPLWYTLSAVGGAVVGAIIGFFVARRLMLLQIKNNPPINEDMIRMMYSQMGVKPSESKIRQIMRSMNNVR